MGKRKSRAQLLTMEAELAVLEEKYDELKRKRPRCEGCEHCDGCGRLKVTGGRSKLDKELRALGQEIRKLREVFRTERAKVAP